MMRKPFAEWRCNLILLFCVLEKRGGGGNVVKLYQLLGYFKKTPFSHLVML